MFALHGIVNGREAFVQWEGPGKFHGDPEVMRRVLALIGDGAQVESTPQGPFFRASDYNERVALATAVAAFDRTTALYGAEDVESEPDEISFDTEHEVPGELSDDDV